MSDSVRENPRSAGNICLTVLAAGIGLAICVADCRRHSQAPPRPADNRYCLDCHLNYGFENFADGHRKAGIGCVRCHGDSIAHSSDESENTAPDRMYSLRQINDACVACHTFGLLPGACELGGDNRVCTDCHNTHRLAKRKRRWDKITGALIFSAENRTGVLDEGMGDSMEDGMDM